jgi:3-dehydroquinate synthase
MVVLNVDLGEHSYPIHVGGGLLREAELLGSHITSSEVMVVTNETVAPLYLDTLLGCLSGYQVTCQALPDGEQYKSLETLAGLFDTLLAATCSRDTTLIALGGGVVGDIAGFAAACYQRGIRFIQVPTTLLAQVDSAVGGKTAVNHPLGKNMIGAFYQPACVFADTDTLLTLAPRQLAAGIAEVVKYGLIRDSSFFKWLEDHMTRLLARDQDALQHAVIESCRHKAAVVAVDEKETGERALLNLGHTFGHAIEAALGYGVWLHGEAVATGMVMAATMSQRLGWLDAVDVQRIRDLLTTAGLPVDPPAELTVANCLEHMAVDKKVTAGRVRLVLLEEIGQARLVSDYPDALLHEVLAGST